MIFNLLERYPLLQADGAHSHGGGGGDEGGGGDRRKGDSSFGTATLEEAYDPLFNFLRKFEKMNAGLMKHIGALRFPLLSFAQTLQRYGSEAIQIQRNTLAFNQDFIKAMGVNGAKIDGLPGGLKTSMDSVVAFQREGIFSANRETIKLANRMKITGQSVAALVNINKKMATQGVMSNLQQNNLIASLQDTSLRYGVSTDTLISSMNKLGESLTVLGFTGGAATTMKGVKDLAAQFPKHGDLIGQLTDQLVTADFGQLARLGVLEDVERIMAGGGNAKELKATFERIADRVQGFGAGVTGVAGRRARMDFAGPVGIMANQLVQGFKDGAIDPQTEAMDNIMKDFRTALDTIFQPLAESVGVLVTQLLNVTAAILKVLPINFLLKAGLAFFTQRFLWDKIQAIRESINKRREAVATLRLTMAINKNTWAQRLGGVQSILLNAAFTALLYFLPNMLGSLGLGIEGLTNLESERNKIELAKLKRDEGPNRFEEFTRMLINDQMRTVQTLDSARSEEMTEFTNQVVDAIHGTTDAVEDTGKINLRNKA